MKFLNHLSLLFVLCAGVALVHPTMKEEPRPQQDRPSVTLTSTPMTNTDNGQGLVDPPKWVYPNGYWQNIGVNRYFRWVPF